MSARTASTSEPVATQLSGELLDRFPAGNECAAEAFAAEPPHDAGADTGSGPDQQEVTRVNRIGHRRLRVELRPAVGSGTCARGPITRRTFTKVRVRRHHRIWVISVPDGI